MKTLAELLADKVGERETKVAESGDGSRTWETLPVDREFRVKVIESGVSVSPSGVPRLDLTLSVVDPDGTFDGRRIWHSWFHTDYDFQLEQIAELWVSIGLTAADIPQSNDYATIFQAVAPKLVDRTMFVTCRNRVGNDGVARTAVRYTNADNGRAPRLNIKPPKAQQSKPDLSVDVSSILNPEPFPATPAAPAVPAASGIRLPTSGGLPRN